MRRRVRARVHEIRERVPIVIADDVPVAIEDAALHRGVAGLVEVLEIDARRHQAAEEVRLRRFADADRRVVARTNEPHLQKRAVGAEDERGQPSGGSAADDDHRAHGLNHLASPDCASLCAARFCRNPCRHARDSASTGWHSPHQYVERASSPIFLASIGEPHLRHGLRARPYTQRF